MRALNNLCRFLNRAFLILGGVSILSLTLIATLNVVLRGFGMPYSGAYELLSFLGAMITAFSLGYTQRQKDHIIVDILSNRYPKRLREGLDVFNYLLLSLFMGLISYHLFKWAIRLRVSGELSENLQIPHYPFVSIVALGFGAYSFTLLVDFVNALCQYRDDK